MKTIAEIFLELNASNTDRGRRTGQSAPDLPALCDATRDAYLAQPDIPAIDVELAPRLFDTLRALVAPTSTAVALPGRVPAPVPARPTRPRSPVLMIVAPVLAAVLIASISIGTLSLSVLLAATLGLLTWFSAGGSLFGFSGGRLLLGSEPEPPALIEVSRPAMRTPGFDRLEDAFRQADALLVRLREPTFVEPVPAEAQAVPDLQFLQDLAEAGSAGDGDHLVKLVSRRLHAAVQGLDLRLAKFGEADAVCFAIDEVPDPQRRGSTETLRPAIMRGDRCLARGYAHRFV